MSQSNPTPGVYRCTREGLSRVLVFDGFLWYPFMTEEAAQEAWEKVGGEMARHFLEAEVDYYSNLERVDDQS